VKKVTRSISILQIHNHTHPHTSSAYNISFVMGAIKQSAQNTVYTVVGKAFGVAEKILPAKVSHAMVAFAWALGFGRGAVVGDIAKGVGNAASAVNSGVKDVCSGVSTAVSGVARAGRGTASSAIGVAKSAMQILNASRAAKDVVAGETAIAKAAVQG
jgi:hypothetical protein